MPHHNVLSHDPLWPRAGDWPAWAPGSRADAVLVGIPTWRTSLSPGQAHTTPPAIRDALRYYSADALVRPDGSRLTVLDAGDALDFRMRIDCGVIAAAQAADLVDAARCAEIHPTRQLTYDHDVEACDHIFFQR